MVVDRFQILVIEEPCSNHGKWFAFFPIDAKVKAFIQLKQKMHSCSDVLTIRINRKNSFMPILFEQLVLIRTNINYLLQVGSGTSSLSVPQGFHHFSDRGICNGVNEGKQRKKEGLKRDIDWKTWEVDKWMRKREGSILELIRENRGKRGIKKGYWLKVLKS